MKKILGISLVALMAVSTARADIASTAYVDVSSEGTYNVVSASNTAGENIAALDAAIGDTSTWKQGSETDNPSVATAIARAVASGTAANVAWSGVTGTPSTLAGYGITDGVQSNAAITGATKTKITYDAKGLVTAGADLAASDIPDISATYVPQTQTHPLREEIPPHQKDEQKDKTIVYIPIQTDVSKKIISQI